MHYYSGDAQFSYMLGIMSDVNGLQNLCLNGKRDIFLGTPKSVVSVSFENQICHSAIITKWSLIHS